MRSQPVLWINEPGSRIKFQTGAVKASVAHKEIIFKVLKLDGIILQVTVYIKQF